MQDVIDEKEPTINRRDFLTQGLTGITAVAGAGLASGCSATRPNLEENLLRSDLPCLKTNQYATYMDAYDANACLECGDCLSGCLFKRYDREAAIKNIIGLRSGDKVICDRNLDTCCFCSQCNHRCPVGAQPGALMLHRLSERRAVAGGTPASIQFVLNGMQSKGWTNNIFRNIYAGHSQTEQKILDDWSEPKDCGEIDLLWCGCSARMFPYDIEHSKVLSGLQKFAGRNDCCGSFAVRAGLRDIARYNADNLMDRLARSRFKRLVVMCGACVEMFTFYLPRYIGQEFPYQVVSVYEYVDELLASSKQSIIRQVSAEERNACLSDSCYGSHLGDNFMRSVNGLYRKIGFDYSELEYSGKNAACCGFMAYMRRGNILDVYSARSVKAGDIKKSNKKNVVSYCHGCFFTANFIMSGKAHYLIEKVLWAMGDEIRYPYAGIPKKAITPASLAGMMRIGYSALF